MIKVLDCTLRDGGYCNDWKFGNANIKKIIDCLLESKIDIIECGFLNQKAAPDTDKTKLPTMQDFADILPENRKSALLVCMINFGDYKLEDIPDRENNFVDGIRIAFHKKDMQPALEFCKGLKEKGYKVFIQAMVSLSYSDEEFLNLIQNVGELKPYAFYIVDSFGVMKRRDLIRLFSIVEHDLSEDIAIGFHSHNNMQLSYSNAQLLADIRTKHNIIIDSSVFGMGRGAGNLNTELFLDYLNENFDSDYKIYPLLRIIDEVLMSFYNRNAWGYSLPNYVSAKYNSHPNYALYLDNKKTLSIESMNEIFSMMDDNKRFHFDKNYMEDLYIRYMSRKKVHGQQRDELIKKLSGKKILLIAPGKSSADEKEIIQAFAKKSDVVSMSINFLYPMTETDFVFVSNLRRFRELDVNARNKCIVTSNVPADKIYLQVDYAELINDEDFVRDNAGLMAIKFLIKCGVKEFFLAGFDGYSHNLEENYGIKAMDLFIRNKISDAMNLGMTKMLGKFSEQVSIQFLTVEKYIHLLKNKVGGENF